MEQRTPKRSASAPSSVPVAKKLKLVPVSLSYSGKDPVRANPQMITQMGHFRLRGSPKRKHYRPRRRPATRTATGKYVV